jgi:hypothetical protein
MHNDGQRQVYLFVCVCVCGCVRQAPVLVWLWGALHRSRRGKHMEGNTAAIHTPKDSQMHHTYLMALHEALALKFGGHDFHPVVAAR